MTDTAPVHIGENSPEQVAYKLLENIAAVEKMVLTVHSGSLASGWKFADRKWILDTYAECMGAVRDYNLRTPSR
jgi:hypothetical protein